MKAMKSIKWVLLIMLLATSGIGTVWADRGHRHPRVGVGIGIGIGPFWGSPFYPAPYYHPSPYYYPSYAPAVIERSPPVYIEQSPPQSAPAAQDTPSNYWYYCKASKAYYPYVNECPSGWHRVSPQPARQP